ncbi:MAG: hypothetical protein HY900_17715 [Deltaproteobacteria bacterium]|nr:hypothetical protein [Deltaproteobacteria bacterium]
MSDFPFRRKNLGLMASGAGGALALLALPALIRRTRACLVGVVREGYAFKEWVAGRGEELKEEVEDVVAEGVHQYEADLAASAEKVEREREILEGIERIAQERLSKIRPEKTEG